VAATVRCVEPQIKAVGELHFRDLGPGPQIRHGYFARTASSSAFDQGNLP
jgi:hypothetical protein